MQGVPTTWGTATWAASQPVGTTLVISVRLDSTPITRWDMECVDRAGGLRVDCGRDLALRSIQGRSDDHGADANSGAQQYYPVSAPSRRKKYGR